MTTERRADENKALRELVDALKDFIAARDALWSLGFFDRIFRFERCVGILNRYDAARNTVRNTVLAVKEATAAAREAAGTEAEPGDAAPRTPKPLVTLEEFEMLLGKPAILKKRPQRARAPQ